MDSKWEKDAQLYALVRVDTPTPAERLRSSLRDQWDRHKPAILVLLAALVFDAGFTLGTYHYHHIQAPPTIRSVRVVVCPDGTPVEVP